MSDSSQGPGWWQASDGKWYPPDQEPGYDQPAGYGQAPGYGGPGAGGYGQGASYGGPPTLGDAFGYGWKKFTENVGPILLAMLGYLVISILIGAATYPLRDAVADSGRGVQIAYQLGQTVVSLLVTSLVELVIIRATLAVLDGRSFELSELFSTDRLGVYLAGSILLSIVTAIGLLLCILPGLAVMLLTTFWGYFLIDRRLGVGDAIRASADLVKDNVGLMIGFVVLSILAVIAGLLACIIGVAVAIPVITIAEGFLYRRLQNGPVAP